MNSQESLGIAGRLAQAFIRSRLTPLLILSALLLGAFAVAKLPREEEPQINVPMFDIFVAYPGASAKEVEERVVNVGERRLWEIPGVEYIYSTSEPGFALFIVRFRVGTDPEEAATRVYAKAFSNLDMLAPGVQPPLVKPRSIDDVPILALTLWSPSLDAQALRQAAALLRKEISAVPDVSETEIIGGRRRTFHVHFDPAKLAARRLTPLDLEKRLAAANVRLPAGHYNRADRTVSVETDALVRSVGDLKRVVLGVSGGSPVRLDDVAQVLDGPDDREQEVSFSGRPAVTLAVAKRRGANATRVAGDVLSRVKGWQTTPPLARGMKPRASTAEVDPRAEPGAPAAVDRVRAERLPAEVRVAITRNYGETAKEKSDELLFHMLLATLSVTLLIAIALGMREALVVLVAIPVTLALTLLVYFLAGYTLNRITLFALIFSIGILVDDAIVVVENIHRHYCAPGGRSLWKLAVDAVSEVGNPTLLATWTVIAAILPMAFVGGLMGPYMRPIPVGASAAMLLSLAIAFIVSPWAFAHLLEIWKPKARGADVKEGALDNIYRRAMRFILESGRARAVYFLGMGLLLAGSVSLIALKKVTVKMLPFDNKDEFEVVLTLPEGSSLEQTSGAAREMEEVLKRVPEVEYVTSYVGTAAPYNFNGLVRHYFLRQRPHQADILVNLKKRHERKRQSHAIAGGVRESLSAVARKYAARVQVAEVPPGPPVLSTLVLEVYGPDDRKRAALARRIRELLDKTDGVVDVDTYVPDPQPLDRLLVDREKTTLNGLAPAEVAQTLALALDGRTVNLAHVEQEEPVEIRLRLPQDHRRDLSAARAVSLLTHNGTMISLGDLTRLEKGAVDPSLYHKNLQPVDYVVADVAGSQESPVYALLKLRPAIDQLARDNGLDLKVYYARQPRSSLETALKWDGEWHITYEVFRDLGIAFALVLILIYILVVAWFESFTVPLVIMAPIPLTLVGILPAHWLMGAFFTATSMIGFIAGAGIVVRNSIILVDFTELRIRQGMSLKEAVIDAGAVRFRPMLLTAAAVVVGAGVILFDPIFQGLAVALMSGEVASTLLSRTAVPVLYYLMKRNRREVQ